MNFIKIYFSLTHQLFVILCEYLLSYQYDVSLLLFYSFYHSCWCPVDDHQCVRGHDIERITAVLLPSLTHWGWDKMDAISRTTFPSASSWMKILNSD